MASRQLMFVSMQKKERTRRFKIFCYLWCGADSMLILSLLRVDFQKMHCYQTNAFWQRLYEWWSWNQSHACLFRSAWNDRTDHNSWRRNPAEFRWRASYRQRNNLSFPVKFLLPSEISVAYLPARCVKFWSGMGFDFLVCTRISVFRFALVI